MQNVDGVMVPGITKITQPLAYNSIHKLHRKSHKIAHNFPSNPGRFHSNEVIRSRQKLALFCSLVEGCSERFFSPFAICALHILRKSGDQLEDSERKCLKSNHNDSGRQKNGWARPCQARGSSPRKKGYTSGRKYAKVECSTWSREIRTENGLTLKLLLMLVGEDERAWGPWWIK